MSSGPGRRLNGNDTTPEEPMGFHPYLNFDGNCREAFTRYHEILGGDLVILPMSEVPDIEVPPEHADRVMHAALTVDGDVLMASDVPPGEHVTASGIYVNYTVADPAEAERVFKELADGGAIIMPIGPTFWSPMFGMCTDRFGIPWMVNTDQPQ